MYVLVVKFYSNSAWGSLNINFSRVSEPVNLTGSDTLKSD